MIAIVILALIGFCISLYAYIVKQKIKVDPTYKPACDIAAWISCSKPFSSPYAHLFIFSNMTIGMIYYAAIAVLALVNALSLLFIAAACAALFSIFLAYILFIKIKSLCVLCTSLYIINFLILALVAYKFYA